MNKFDIEQVIHATERACNEVGLVRFGLAYCEWRPPWTAPVSTYKGIGHPRKNSKQWREKHAAKA